MKNIKKELLTFAAIFTLIVVFDFIWLGIIQKSYFTEIIKKLNCGGSNKVNWPSIVITYFVMAFSLYYFVFHMAEENISLAMRLLRAILIAMAIYVVFDFTLLNMASAWGWNDAIKDIAWGNVLFVTVAVITHYIHRG